MHILYIHQYFATPHGTTGTRSYEFAKRWVAAGHRVTVLTSVGQLTERDLGGPPSRLVMRQNIDGIDLVVLNVPYRQTFGFARRVWAFLVFMLLACWQALRIKRVDAVYATSTPLTVGVPALVAWWLRRRWFVFEVRDVWPAVPIAMGAIRNRLLIRGLKMLERRIYRSASAIVVLSPGMKDRVQRDAPRGALIETIPNSADTTMFHPGVDGSAPRRAHGWEGKFVCIHAGAMGRVNGLDVIVKAAEHFRTDPEFRFVLVGEGGEKPNLLAMKAKRGLDNLDIIDAVSKDQLPQLVAAADLCLVTVTNVEILQDNSANKFFDALSAGKPVVINYGGWQREVLESAGAGLGCDQGDDAAFFANIAALKADPQRREAIGRRSRELATDRFNRDALAAQALAVLTQTRQPRKATPTQDPG
ncbi:MAG: glycosyltransferase family 4 protein [Phycisphaerae bacterium]|jgi:glycosyltransferase involved in cell wall biosynthesis